MKEVKNVVIWGAGVRGKYVFDFLEGWDAFNVVAFGDNDIKKQGKEYCGKTILSSSEVALQPDLDCVIIASRCSGAIYDQLKQLVQIPVYQCLDDINVRASIDISGWCNARCKWCATGIKNKSDGYGDRKYMSYETFEKVYRHLTDTAILNRLNEILLYSWGEPFLNPDCMKIMEFLSDEKQVFSVSTNASVFVPASGTDTYRFCKTFICSMPGFSQQSYDRIHGFQFEKIKENIKRFTENLYQCGFEGEKILSYHVYQFNQSETDAARAFADSLGFTFAPVYAYFASYGLSAQYLTDTMPYDLLKEAGKDLLLHHVEELLEHRPKDFQCSVENMISINSEGMIELCCCCDSGVKDYLWGNVWDVKNSGQWKQMRKDMLACQTCKECRKAGIDYWFFHNPEYVG